VVTLDDPTALLLIVLVPLVVYAGRKRARIAIGYPSTGGLAQLPASFRTRLAHALPWLRALTLAVCAVALADPRWGLESTKSTREGIAIVVVVDISSSMQALDLQGGDEPANRLEVVKETLRGFVEGEGELLGGREGDAIGMVTFARFGDTVSPLTLDHEALLAALAEVDVVALAEEDGTAIGDAMVLGTDLLKRADAESRVMIVLTDGANNAGEIEPMDAAWVAKTFGITVHTIGASSRGTEPIEAGTSDDGTRLLSAPGFIDEHLLEQVAELTGGRFFRATDGTALASIYAEIDRLEKSTNVAEQYQRQVQVFPIVLIVALALLSLEAVLGNTILRTTP
jgi:Ca-activated chloride channel family protein